MASPQHFMPGTNSGLPLQRAFCDLAFELPDPFALGIEHRDLVLQLDESQSRHARCAQVTHHPVQLLCLGAEGNDALAEELCRLPGREVMHEHEPRGEVGVVAGWLRQDRADDFYEQLAAGLSQLVDGSFRPPALLLALDRDDQAVALENLDRVVQRAEVQPDELVVMALAHRRGELVRMHGPFIEEFEDGESEWRDARCKLRHIPDGIYVTGHPKSNSRLEAT